MTPGPDEPGEADGHRTSTDVGARSAAHRPHLDPIHGFALDAFQVAAIEALDRGESVLVAAPTGSGKTVVAEHAVAAALAAGGRAFYTTPIKALSNQKFHDLVDQHGANQVGLLTGDNAVNGDAPVVVMTTEVLRNMIYARSGALTGLQVVVLDEVHYLQDAYRGPVWEEVIIHLPPEVRLVCLSATVSNAGELADWLTTVRGTTTVVVETTRPVSLENHYLAGDKLAGELRWAPLLRDGRPDPDGARFDRVDAPSPGRGRGGGGGRPRRRWYTPDRVSVVEALRERRLLPALYFIFSRAACDDAVAACLGAGLRLTDAAARHRIGEILDDHLAALGDADLAVLGYDQLRAGLEAGIASHHAGLVPPFKEAVEQCFVEGLVQVVFATETLALGINMPARTVVIEKLTKFTGEHHETLTPGQYTQLTGRAGRRGIDHEGHAVVLWSPWTSFADTAALAASRTFELTSAFRPTYNMAANLVRRYEPAEAHHLLNLSFAQFRADQSVVRLETRLDRAEERLAGLEERATCERGAVGDYVAALDAAEARSRAASSARRRDAEAALRALRPGDVVDLPGRQDRPGVVLSVAERKGGGLRLRILSSERRMLTLGRDDLPDGPDRLGRVELPVPFSPGAPRFQREVVTRLGRTRLRRPSGGPGPGAARGTDADDLTGEHPVPDCPDLADHVRAWRRAERARTEVADLRRRVAQGTGSLARRFDRVLQLLEAWGFLDGWALTGKGERLVRIFHEADLLVAEALDEGIFDGLDPASLAGLASCFTYEHRSPVPPEPAWFPSPDVARRVDRLDELAAELAADEERLGLPTTRAPDSTFFALAHAWAAGTGLEEVLEDEDLSGGDFVRNVKQLVDLLRQLGDAAADPATSAAARQAAEAVFRGVVAASAEVTA